MDFDEKFNDAVENGDLTLVTSERCHFSTVRDVFDFASNVYNSPSRLKLKGDLASFGSWMNETFPEIWEAAGESADGLTIDDFRGYADMFHTARNLHRNGRGILREECPSCGRILRSHLHVSEEVLGMSTELFDEKLVGAVERGVCTLHPPKWGFDEHAFEPCSRGLIDHPCVCKDVDRLIGCCDTNSQSWDFHNRADVVSLKQNSEDPAEIYLECGCGEILDQFTLNFTVIPDVNWSLELLEKIAPLYIEYLQLGNLRAKWFSPFEERLIQYSQNLVIED